MSNSKKPKKAIDPNIVEAPMETSSDELVAEVTEEVKEVKKEAPKIVEAAEEPAVEEAPAPVEEIKEDLKNEEAPAVEEKKPEPVKEEVKEEEAIAEAPVAKAEEPNANDTTISEEALDKAVEAEEDVKEAAPAVEEIDTNKKFMLVVVASKINPADKIVAKIMANKKVAEVINVNEIVVDDNNERVVVFTTDDKKAAVQMQKRLVGCGVKTSIESK